MLIARGQIDVGSGSFAWGLAFTASFWAGAIERKTLVLDTRFVPPASGPPKDSSCLYLLLNGDLVVHEQNTRFEGPAAFVLSKEQLEGANGRRSCTFRAAGDPYRAIEIHLAASEIRSPASIPPRVELPPAVWDVAMRAGNLAHDDAAEPHMGELFQQLAQHGVVGNAIAVSARRSLPKPLVRIWKALRPLIQGFVLTPTLQDVSSATGTSLRQADRDLEWFFRGFGLSGARWREVTLHLRLKLAVIFLSAEDASLADVARVVGYGSTDAMARAFRDAGLPPPNTVRQQIVASR